MPGALAHLGLAKETEWGTPQAATDYLPFVSTDITEAIEELVSESLLGRFAEPDSYQGLRSVAGNIIAEVRPTIFGHFLRSALGPPVSAGAGTRNLFHTEGGPKAITANTNYSADVQPHMAMRLSLAASATNGGFVGGAITIQGTVNGLPDSETVNFAAPGTKLTAKFFSAIAVEGIQVKAAWANARLLMTGPEVYEHTFGAVQSDLFDLDCHLWPYTLELYKPTAPLNGDVKAFQIAGAVANTLELELGIAQKILRATVGLIGKSVALIDKTTPTLEALPPFLWDALTLTRGGAPWSVLQNIRLSVDNRAAGEERLRAGSTIAAIERTDWRRVRLSGRARFRSLDEYQEFSAGSAAAVVAALEGSTIIGARKYGLQMTLPQSKIVAYPIGVPDRAPLMVDFDARAEFASASGTELSIVLTNTKPSY